jgi:hypothetical protein
VTDDATVGGASTGQITLAAVTVNDGKTLTLGTGVGAPITTGTVSGVAGGTASNLTINTTGAASVGVVGTDVGTVTVTNSGGTTFTGAVTTGTSVVLTNTTGDIAFNGALTTPTLTATANAYNVKLNAGGTVDNAVTFNNTGTLTIGDAAADNMAFTAGVTATAPSSKSIAGTISAAGTGVINLGTSATTVTDDATVGGASTGQITLAAVTVNDGKTLTLGAGAATPITTGTVSGVAANAASNLTINTTGAVSVGTVGTDIGTIRVTQSGGTHFTSTVDAATVTLTNTTGDIAFNGTLTATTLNTAGWPRITVRLAGGVAMVGPRSR